MATRIRASCPECGDVEIGVPDVRVRFCIDQDSGSYVFRCPSCLGRVVKDAERRVLDLLETSGVEVTRWRLPAEIWEEKGQRPAFTHDDLLDFHTLLASDDWVVSLLGSANGDPSVGLG